MQKTSRISYIWIQIRKPNIVLLGKNGKCWDMIIPLFALLDFVNFLQWNHPQRLFFLKAKQELLKKPKLKYTGYIITSVCVCGGKFSPSVGQQHVVFTAPGQSLPANNSLTMTRSRTCWPLFTLFGACSVSAGRSCLMLTSWLRALW